MQQLAGAGPHFGLGPKYGGYERKQCNRNEHHNPILNGQVLDKDKVVLSVPQVVWDK